MRIGYFTFGFLKPPEAGHIDGSWWIRKPFLLELMKKHYIVFMYKKYMNKENFDKDFPKACYTCIDQRELIRKCLKPGQSLRKSILKATELKFDWPEIDYLIVELSILIPAMVFQYAMIYHYVGKIPIVILDQDLWTRQFLDRFKSIFNVDIEDKIIVLAIYLKRLFKNQISVFPPYIREELPISDQFDYDYVYMGHDNNRRKDLKKWYLDIYEKYPEFKIRIFGKYKEDILEKYGHIISCLSDNEVPSVLNRTVCTMAITKDDYKKVGGISRRIMETPQYGCVLMVDKDIYGVDKYVLEENIIKSEEHLVENIRKYKKDPKLRRKVIEEQRKILRQYSIDDWLKKLKL